MWALDFRHMSICRLPCAGESVGGGALNPVKARAYEDLSGPDGGQIVVLLQDIVRAPSPCGFRLRPPEFAADEAMPAGWPDGELMAADTRTTRTGVEVVLGPEVARYEALTAGTPIEISLSGTRIRARFVWPEVSFDKPARRRNITLVPSRRASKTETSKGTVRRSQPAPAETSAAPSDGARKELQQRDHARPSSPSAEEPVAMPPAPSIFDKLAALDALADGSGPAGAGADDVGSSAAPVRSGAGEKIKALSQDSMRKPAREEPAPQPQAADPVVELLRELKRDIVQIKQEQATLSAPREEQHLYGMLADLRRDIDSLKRHEAQLPPPNGEKQLYGLLAELRKDIETLKRQEAGYEPPSGEKQLYGLLAELRHDIEALKHHEVMPAVAPGEKQLYGLLAELRRDIEDLRHHETPATPKERELLGMLAELKRDIRTLKSHTPEPAGRRRQGVVGWARGQSAMQLLLLALVPLAALVMLASDGWRHYNEPAARQAAQLVPLTAAGTAGRSALPEATGSPVFAALTAGNVSPRGVSASGVTAPEILGRINAERQAGRGQLGAEGEFWMKRYLIANLGDNNTARVLTQLGSLYAEGGASADYGKARQLWEVAGGLGDAIAMCFLGTLYDSGLGVAADRRVALQWYERARDAGGCAGAGQLPGGAR